MKKKSFFLTAVATISLATATIAQTVPSYVPTNGLVGWWPFNGNANDESGNNNNGTVNGATLTTDRFGNAGKAYDFNGNNISTNYSGISGNGSRSISFWYNLNQNTSNSDMNVMVAYGGNGSCGGGWSCSILGNKPVIDISTSYAVYNNLGALNSWYFYCITYDPTFGSSVLNTRVYINGILQTTTSLTNAIGCIINTGTINKLQFGGYSNPLNFFHGKLDDIGIWNRALTQQEITDLYNANLVGFNPITYQNTIKIFPNPTSDHITIDYGNFASLNGYQLKITNSLGQQMFQTTINQQSSYVSLASWTGNGIYFVHIIDPQGNTIDIRKIVLQ